jgi:hypothetical protein
MPPAGDRGGVSNTEAVGPRVAAVVLALIALAGCGSSTTVTTTVTGGSASATKSAASSAASTTSPTSTSTSTATSHATTAAGLPLCRAATLSLSFLGQQGATGHGELGFALRNTGARTCHTFGYPGILFLGRSGQPLPTIPTHSTRDFFGVTPVVGINVAPGRTVSFRLQVTHGIASPVGCGTAYGLQVIPPNDTSTLRTTMAGGA